PAIGTTPSETSGKIGDTLTDNAGLTLATSDAGGTISFYLFKPGDNCSDLGTAVYSSTGVAVSGNGTYHSADGTTKTGSNVTTQARSEEHTSELQSRGHNISGLRPDTNKAVVIGLNSPALGTTPSDSSSKIVATLPAYSGLTFPTSDAAAPFPYTPLFRSDNCSDLGTAVYSSTGVAVSGNGTYHSADGTTKTGSNVTTQA